MRTTLSNPIRISAVPKSLIDRNGMDTITKQLSCFILMVIDKKQFNHQKRLSQVITKKVVQGEKRKIKRGP
ncbi:MAG: hypothetical protein OXC61_08600 [Flavobacteriaceae bacterium]|nr:hypothetical protein [Flavobacteriaceae bacterium]